MPGQMLGDFEGGALEGGSGEKGVMSFLSNALGMSPNHYGKNHRHMGKFIEHHYGGHFFLVLLKSSRLRDWGWV